MPKVSINILTRNRAELLRRALASVEAQTFRDFEVVVVNDASTDSTGELLEDVDSHFYNVISRSSPRGITFNRQAALDCSKGEYVAILDDDDEWIDADKLKKQVDFLDNNREYVLVGGGIVVTEKSPDVQQASGTLRKSEKSRAQTDVKIRKTMLLRNNFFTSTVMFRKAAAVAAGGFIADDVDLGEDYDLWLRLGKFGKFYNCPEAFAKYAKGPHNVKRFRQFLAKHARMIKREKTNYPLDYLAAFILRIRTLLQG